MQPSDLLVAAADRVRDLAAAAVQGPWRVEADGPIVSVVGARDEAVTTDAEWSASWIAALSPAVAPHLESILRKRAEVIKWAKSWDEVADIGEYHLARLLCPDLAEEKTP